MAVLSCIIVLTNLLFFPQFHHAMDTITQFQSLPDGKTLVSKAGKFELGFFSPNNSINRHVGIWFKNISIRTVVWVLNQGKPIKDNSSKISINREGELVLLSQDNTVIWMANSTNKALSPILQLLDSGNLVLRDQKDPQNPQNYLWQSFDYPSDTLLPGMKYGWDLRTSLVRRITAWRNWDDPSPGDFKWEFVNPNNPEFVFWKGSTKYFRSGPWTGNHFSGTFRFRIDSIYEITFVSNKDEVYFMYNPVNESLILRFILNKTTSLRHDFIWNEEEKSWKCFSYLPRDDCDTYNFCGPNGNCILGETPVCQCLSGFKPKSPKNWNTLDWTEGCVRSEPWHCKAKNRDNFGKFSGLKLPDTEHSWVNASLTLQECKAKCFENCSCTAYAYSNMNSGGVGCTLWFGDLLDIRQITFPEQDLYIRLAISETAEHEGNDRNKRKVIGITITILLALVMMLFTVFYIYRSKWKSGGKLMSTENNDGLEEVIELPSYDLDTIVDATNNFSMDRKLGQGGFGPVYKGTLPDGQEIAVKRLSRSSHQGMNEFKNEVVLCAKLQHRNLVKVLGYCVEGQEKMLIYEYMPNKSLDSFIFGSTSQSKVLGWSRRFHIICGIARGLLYLHQDSRLKIIHRDLKASNILLDNELNPKISDFGLARIFEGDQVGDNTSRVVGTYGYMAPEYAFDGSFSIKSDVFSFGILLLEIVSGLRNRGVSYPNHSLNLIGHAWKLWREDMPLKLVDARLLDSCVVSEVLRCIHIGLLCIQQHPEDRPSMESVVVMLSNVGALPQPREPGFLLEKNSIRGESSSSSLTASSTNEISNTHLEAR